MKYFHRTNVSPETVLDFAARFLGATLAPVEESPGRRQFAGSIGRIAVTARPEGGHYTLVTVDTNQVAESEADKLGKRFLTMVHTLAEPAHRPIGAY